MRRVPNEPVPGERRPCAQIVQQAFRPTMSSGFSTCSRIPKAGTTARRFAIRKAADAAIGPRRVHRDLLPVAGGRDLALAPGGCGGGLALVRRCAARAQHCRRRAEASRSGSGRTWQPANVRRPSCRRMPGSRREVSAPGRWWAAPSRQALNSQASRWRRRASIRPLRGKSATRCPFRVRPPAAPGNALARLSLC